MTLTKLSSNLFNFVIDFLTLEDFVSLSFVCRKFYKHIQSENRLFLKEYLKSLFPNDLSYFYEPYEELAFQEKFIGTTPKRIFKMSQNPFWKDALMNKCFLKNQWMNFFLSKSKNSKNESIDFINKINEALQNPTLPSLLMVRENYGKYCETTLQHKILENALYYDTNIFNFDLEDNTFLEFLNNTTPLKESEREDLLEIRWYGTHTNIQDFRNSNKLFQIHQILTKTLENYVYSISQYLDSLENPFDLLQEYCAFWKRFTFSIFEIEGIFKEFTKAINENYEKEFKDYPNFPKYSILRLMIKIWIKIIFDINKQKLLGAFDIAIQELRQNKSKMIVERSSELFEKFIVEQPNYYKNNEVALEQLIHIFLSCLTDSSIHELTIHHLGHSEILLSNPFTEFEKEFHSNTEQYYSALNEALQEDPMKLEEILSSDVELFKNIINEKMMKKLKQNKYQMCSSNFVKNLQSQIKKINSQIIDRTKKLIKPNKITMMMELIKETDPKYHHLHMHGYFLSSLYKSLIRTYGKNIINVYRNNKSKAEVNLNKKRKKDMEIEEVLDCRNYTKVPREILDFFEFSKTTNIKNLKKFQETRMKNKKIMQDLIECSV